MKVCITSRGDSLESEIDPRFGRCEYFVFLDTESSDMEAIKNPNIISSGGAGIQSGQLVAGKQVNAVLTGNVGPNAWQTLRAAGIEVIIGVSGTVGQAWEKFKNKELKPVKGPSVDSKFGMPAE